MNIGFDAKRAFLNRSGLGNYSRDIIRSLHQQNPEHDYFLYTPRTSDFFSESGTNLILKMPPANYGKVRQAHWRSVKLSGQIKTDKIDIFHGLSNELPEKIDRSGAKSVVTIHDLIFMRYPQWYNRIDRAIYKRKFRYSSQEADAVITVSQQTKNDLIEFFKIPSDKIKVIYQGCNKAFYKVFSKEEKKQVLKKWGLPTEYILYVGTVEPRKNLLNLVKAMHHQKMDMPLIVVGKPTPYQEKVKAYIQKHKLQNISFLQQVAVEDLPGIYQQAKVFVYPSVFEGFGIPILEAMVSGIPVITSSGSCFSEVGGKETLYVDPNNSHELGITLQQVLDDSNLRQNMIKAGLEHAAQFKGESVAKEIMNLYQSLL